MASSATILQNSFPSYSEPLLQPGTVNLPSTAWFQLWQGLWAVLGSGSGQLVGNQTGGQNNAGSVGEYVSDTLTTQTPLTSGALSSVIQISLTAGIWDLQGSIVFTPTSATLTDAVAGISTVNNVMPTAPGTYSAPPLSNTNYSFTINTPVVSLVLAQTTTVYLVVNATFTGGTVAEQGILRARRVG